MSSKLYKLMKGEVSLKDMYYYLQGNLRYRLYYRFPALLPAHIIQQIDYRIRHMNQNCYEHGSCHLCGCQTTQLQMCNKSCEGLEYPPMMSKDKWQRKAAIFQEDMMWVWSPVDDMYNTFKLTSEGYVPYNTN